MNEAGMIQDFWAMGGYGEYIWPAYGFAAIVLLWLFFRSSSELGQAENRLKQLQSSLAPDTEKNG